MYPYINAVYSHTLIDAHSLWCGPFMDIEDGASV